MNKLNSIIWDADGTLLDSRERAWQAAEGVITLVTGKPCSIASHADEQRVFGLEAQVNIAGDHASALRMMHRLIMKGGAHNTKLFNQVLSIIPEIPLRHSIATANLASGIVIALGDYAQLFNEIRGFEHGPKYELISQLKENKNSIYVGDTVRDIMICRKLGIPIVAVTWGGFEDPKLVANAEPDFLVETPAQLLNLVKSLI